MASVLNKTATSANILTKEAGGAYNIANFMIQAPLNNFWKTVTAGFNDLQKAVEESLRPNPAAAASTAAAGAASAAAPASAAAGAAAPTAAATSATK